MIPNYEPHPAYKVLHQSSANPFVYDAAYAAKYNAYAGRLMSDVRLEQIERTIGRTPKSLLDVGYGNGDFLRACNAKGIFTYGFDVSGVPPPDGTLTAINISVGCEVVTFFDSLEHCEDIGEMIGSLNCSYVAISVPVLRSSGYSDEWFEGWKHRRPDEHLWHFTCHSLIQFMESFGYVALSLTNVEDSIRKPTDEYPNILTGIFKKIVV